MSLWDLLRGKKKTGLDAIKPEEIRRALCEVQIKCSKAERNERLADEEVRTLVKEAILAEGQAAKRTFLRRAAVEKKKQRLYGKVADSLSKVQSALEMLSAAKETSADLKDGLNILPEGVTIEGVELGVAQLVAGIRGQTDIAAEVTHAVESAWGQERLDADLREVMREVEVLEEAMIEGKDQQKDLETQVTRIVERL